MTTKKPPTMAALRKLAKRKGQVLVFHEWTEWKAVPLDEIQVGDEVLRSIVWSPDERKGRDRRVR